MFPLYLFVYGTLLQELSNHHLIKHCKLIATAKTIEKYALYCGKYPTVNSLIPETIITGEIYEIIDQQTLDSLDELEEHPDVYVRTDCAVKRIDTDELMNVQIYFCNLINDDNYIHQNCVKISSGNFRTYLDEKKLIEIQNE